MVSLEDNHTHSHSHNSIINTASSNSHFTQTRPYYYTPPPSSVKINRSMGRSMRTIRSTIFSATNSSGDCSNSGTISENLTDSVIDIHLKELATKIPKSDNEGGSNSSANSFLDLSQAYSDFSAFSSDISGELQRLAGIPQNPDGTTHEPEPEPEPCCGFLEREKFSTEIIESISPEDLQPTVKLCVDSLKSSSTAVKRSAAAKLRMLAKNRADNRAMIGESGAIPMLIPLLRCTDPWTQEHAVTALLNLSLHEPNKALIASYGGVKSLIYVLKTGTDTSKQNAACGLLSLALVDEYKLSIGACGGIPPLVCLLVNGTNRGKKDALTTLYKLCSVRLNKERAISAGVVKPLVGLVGEQGNGLAEKAMVVLSILAGIDIGKDVIVEEGGIAALVEAVEDSSDKGKEFAVLTLLQLCVDSVRNRGLLVREGGIPPLVALSQNGTAKAKHKAETLLGYLREPRQEASSSTP
ncbi:putative inositol transporter 4 isoform 1 [Capsicum annuum]|uniref:U-box domain-containing protein 4 n=1 Tax=Capsicum annuum TaxID=4072 RepID=UPI0007BFC0F6|nr:U-box domain-containing protein 4 [Capsicum annuum]KAF3635586.1 putative inositol transporter 4 isoform 1 [Capsicum annuum]KAF3637079.1 putative inositol transporter 4 isoform 1 [Capsicum annuum]